MKPLLALAPLFMTGRLFCQIPSIEWQHCYGGSGDEIATDIIQLANSNYIIVGQTDSNNGDIQGNHGSSDIFVMCLDSNGIIIWQKCFGGTLAESANSIMQTSNGNFLISGLAYSNDGDVSGNHSNSGRSDMWILSLDQSGNLLWQKCFGGSENEEATTEVEADNGEFIIAGYTDSHDGNVIGNHDSLNLTSDSWVIKIDSIGNLLTQRCLGGSAYEKTTSVLKDQTNGYWIGGSCSSNDGDVSGLHGNTYDYWHVKLDSNLDLVWERPYGGSMNNQFSFCMNHTNSGGYIMGGYSMFDTTYDMSSFHGSSGSGSDSWLIKTDSAGNLIYEKCYGGTDNEIAYSIFELFNRKIIICGFSTSNDGDVYGNHGYDIWLLEVDSSLMINWQKCIGGSSWEEPRKCIHAIDDGLTIAGTTNSNDGDVSGNHGNSDAWIVKLGALGTRINAFESEFIEFDAFFISNKLMIRYVARRNMKIELELFDTRGQKIVHLGLTVCQGMAAKIIDHLTMPSGMYFVRVSNELGYTTKKIIVE